MLTGEQMRSVEFGNRNLDSLPSITNKFQKNAISMSLLRRRESRKPSKGWIPDIKRGAGLLEFIPLKNGAGMTPRRPRRLFQQPTNLIVRRFRTLQSGFRIYVKVLLILCMMPLAACGYQMVGKETHVPPGLNSVAVPTFKNRTYEPGIEVPFTQAFLNEFILDRRVNVVNRAQADSVLEGFITDFRIYSVSYDRSGFVVEYQTSVVLDLTLKDRTGKVLWEEKNFSETQWFRASSGILINEANKSAAIQQIGRLVAERLRNRFFYNF
jgi:outer membrane lipopolysaccharide assembly protein LptE/RlpB